MKIISHICTIGLVAVLNAAAVARDVPRGLETSVQPVVKSNSGFAGVAGSERQAIMKEPLFGGPSSSSTSLSGTSFRTYGYYSASTGTAVEGERWTFDHVGGVGEGWVSRDLTTDAVVAARRVSTALWAGHGNVPAAPVLAGSVSVWMGVYEDGADAACWASGLGYGNNWRQRFKSPSYTNTSGNVTLTFKYFYDVENSFDNINVVIDNGVTRNTIATFTGVGGSPGAPLNFNQSFAVSGNFRVLFELITDFSNSDEDGYYTTTNGPFGVDDILLSGIDTPVQTASFEAGMQGWSAEAIPGVGSYAAFNSVDNYLAPGAHCGMSADVVTFHNGGGDHEGYQHERYFSPTVDVSRYGTVPLNVFAEYNFYGDLPAADEVTFTWGFRYFPYICPVTGDSIWSDPAGPGASFFTTSPHCEQVRSFANDLSGSSLYSSGTTLIPAGSDSIKFYVEVESTNGSVQGNFSPLIDNVMIGVSSQATILHVPSPSYPTIISAISAASVDDTILVRAGTYTGIGNRDIDYGGKNVVLLSEQGSDSTVIDCGEEARAFAFNNGESSAAIVDGFTLTRGKAGNVGSAIVVGDTAASSPMFRNCVIRNNHADSGNGVINLRLGAASFRFCQVVSDTALTTGAIVVVRGGGHTFTTSIFSGNLGASSIVNLLAGAPHFTNCDVASNVAPSALRVSTAATITACNIFGNSEIGMSFVGGTSFAITSATNVIGNGGRGIEMLGSNSSSFFSCNVKSNSGGGIIIRGVTTSAAAAGADAAPAEALATLPYYYDCVIAGNIVTDANGGGILLDCSNVPTTTFSPSFENCTITGNSTSFDGGGIAICGTALYANITPYLLNCTIASNSAGWNGGGLYSGADSVAALTVVTVETSILWGNCSVIGSGAQAFADGGNMVEFQCSDVDTNGITALGFIDYGFEGLYVDPLFCQYEPCNTGGTTAGDYTLEVSSMLSPDNSPCLQLIGASPPVCVYVSAPDAGQGTPAQDQLLPCVPNPFNPSTSIRFDVADHGRVVLAVYDVAGHEVKRLIDEVMSPSRNSTTWDGTDHSGRFVASGVYFSMLQTPAGILTGKLVLIK